MGKRILVVEDDPDIAQLISIQLADLGFTVELEDEGIRGYERAVAAPFCAIILDVMLPRLNGIEVCRKLRAAGVTTPILFLSCRGEVVDRIRGLDVGGDDYLPKPFDLDELTARIRALLRRQKAADPIKSATLKSTAMQLGGLSIDRDTRQVAIDGRRVDLTATEFDLLWCLASRPGRVFTREELLLEVWNYEYDGYEHTVNSHINRLRTKIEINPAKPCYVVTVWGVGYRFAESSEMIMTGSTSTSIQIEDTAP